MSKLTNFLEKNISESVVDDHGVRVLINFDDIQVEIYRFSGMEKKIKFSEDDFIDSYVHKIKSKDLRNQLKAHMRKFSNSIIEETEETLKRVADVAVQICNAKGIEVRDKVEFEVKKKFGELKEKDEVE